MTYYTLKLSASLPLAKTTLYKIERDDPLQTYSDFCALKQRSEYPPSLWEIVNITLDDIPYALLVDESGYCHDTILPVNQIASSFYAGPVPIVGDVFVLVPRAPELYFMTKQELQPWEDLFEHYFLPNVDPYYTWKIETLD